MRKGEGSVNNCGQCLFGCFMFSPLTTISNEHDNGGDGLILQNLYSRLVHYNPLGGKWAFVCLAAILTPVDRSGIGMICSLSILIYNSCRWIVRSFSDRISSRHMGGFLLSENILPETIISARRLTLTRITYRQGNESALIEMEGMLHYGKR